MPRISSGISSITFLNSTESVEFAMVSADQVNSPADVRITVCYLDEDMTGTSAAVAPLLRRRWANSGIGPLLAGPFLPIVPWEWDRNLPA